MMDIPTWILILIMLLFMLVTHDKVKDIKQYSKANNKMILELVEHQRGN